MPLEFFLYMVLCVNFMVWGFLIGRGYERLRQMKNDPPLKNCDDTTVTIAKALLKQIEDEDKP